MMFLVVELAPILGLATNTARHVTYREIEQQSWTLLTKGQTGPLLSLVQDNPGLALIGCDQGLAMRAFLCHK